MPGFLLLLRQFRDDQRGAFAIMFGVIAVVLIAMGGAVVDYVSLEQARNRAQIALDAAALALQPRIFEKPVDRADIQQKAQALLNERLGGGRAAAQIEAVEVDVPNGSLLLRAHMDISTIFVSLVGVEEMSASLISEATRKQLALEVVMVLDNSSSMSQQNRITYLQNAAKCAANTLFYTEVVDSDFSKGISQSCEPASDAEQIADVRIGLVPFTATVNVGSSYASADWIDRDGLSSIAADNFDDDQNEDTPYRGPVKRLDLFASLNSNEGWRGCVEARPHKSTGSGNTLFLDTDDTPPTRNDGDTLFVPFFSPDLPDGGNRGPNYGNQNYISDTGGSCTRNNNLSEREKLEQVCKYDNARVSASFSVGPNAECTLIPIQPLTDDPVAVTDTIARMKASGYTNIHEGTAWGFRVLSPTEPFSEGVDYTVTTNSKVMIIMTDGENTAATSTSDAQRLNGASSYTAYGWPRNGRLGNMGWSNSALVREMDTRTLQTCTNAKAEGVGIRIYTIGLGSNSTTRQMLTNCASSTGNAHFPSNPSQLKDVFKSIADDLAALRLAL